MTTKPLKRDNKGSIGKLKKPFLIYKKLKMTKMLMRIKDSQSYLLM